MEEGRFTDSHKNAHFTEKIITWPIPPTLTQNIHEISLDDVS